MHYKVGNFNSSCIYKLQCQVTISLQTNYVALSWVSVCWSFFFLVYFKLIKHFTYLPWVALILLALVAKSTLIGTDLHNSDIFLGEVRV